MKRKYGIALTIKQIGFSKPKDIIEDHINSNVYKRYKKVLFSGGWYLDKNKLKEVKEGIIYSKQFNIFYSFDIVEYFTLKDKEDFKEDMKKYIVPEFNDSDKHWFLIENIKEISVEDLSKYHPLNDKLNSDLKNHIIETKRPNPVYYKIV